MHLENKHYYGLGSVFCSKIMSKKLNIQLYMTLIRPVVLYDSETRTWEKSKKQDWLCFNLKENVWTLENGGYVEIIKEDY